MMVQRLRPLIMPALLTAITFLYFGHFLDNFFVFDDFFDLSLVMEGPINLLRGCDYISPRIVTNSLRWPLHALSGNNPLGYNLFSVTLYAVNGYLFFLFVNRLSQDRTLAGVSAIIFISTAVACDVVLWKAAYCGLLCFAFYMATLLTYLHCRSSEREVICWPALAFFSLAMFSKEEAASLPFVLVAMELLIQGNRSVMNILKRVLPFCLVIVGYLAFNHILVNYLLHSANETALYSSLNLRHALLAPWSVFFLRPNGILSSGDPSLYLAGLTLLMSIFLAGNRKYLFFALIWVLVTFLPQSLASSPESFAGKMIVNSISRYLYLPSAGAALIYALAVIRLKRMFPANFGNIVCVLILAVYLAVNYCRVQQRGEEWAEKGVPMRTMLRELKRMVPSFPPYSYVLARRTALPTERNFFEQALRSFYNNRKLYYIYNERTFVPLPDMTVYIIEIWWLSPTDVRLVVTSKKY